MRLIVHFLSFFKKLFQEAECLFLMFFLSTFQLSLSRLATTNYFSGNEAALTDLRHNCPYTQNDLWLCVNHTLNGKLFNSNHFLNQRRFIDNFEFLGDISSNISWCSMVRSYMLFACGSNWMWKCLRNVNIRTGNSSELSPKRWTKVIRVFCAARKWRQLLRKC